MGFPIDATPNPDAEVDKTIANIFHGAAGEVHMRLRQATEILSDTETARRFWERRGTTGAAVLSAFASFRDCLLAVAPELVTEDIAQAGSTLTVAEDGTVTLPI